eukprot:Clim_evm1s147 gene=Clim_evmTU1s147
MGTDEKMLKMKAEQDFEVADCATTEETTFVGTSEQHERQHSPLSVLDTSEIIRVTEKFNSHFSHALTIFGFVIIVVTKQLATKGTTSWNGGVYPFEASLLTLMIIAMKLVISIGLFSLSSWKESSDSDFPRSSLASIEEGAPLLPGKTRRTRQSDASLDQLPIGGGQENTKPAAARTMSWDIRYAIPALSYVVLNWLNFQGVHNTSPALWSLLVETRIIWIAVFYRVVTHLPVTKAQYCSMVFLAFGVGIAEYGQKASGVYTSTTGGISRWQGLLCGLSFGLLSALFSLYTERVMKRRFFESFWSQQVQMYVYAFVISTIWFVVENSATGFAGLYRGFDSLPAVAAFTFSLAMNAASGIYGAMLLKYQGNMVKMVAFAISIVFMAIGTSVMFNKSFVMNWQFIVGGCCVVCASLMFEFLKHKTSE